MDKYRFKGRFVRDNFVADMIRLKDGAVGLMTYDNKRQDLIPGRSFMFDGKEYETVVNNNAKTLSLANGEGEAKNAVALIAEIKSLLKRVVKLPLEEQYTLLSVFILSTWVYREYANVIYVIFTGNAGSGKSSAQNSCHYLCYNSFRVAGSSTNSSLVRSIDGIQGTVCVDEVQVFASDMRSESHAILAVGFSSENGFVTKSRALKSGDWVVDEFDMFAPKILSGRRNFTDEALVSRCVEFRMLPYNISEIPSEKPTNKLWQEDAAKLRNDLLYWSQRRALGELEAKAEYRKFAEMMKLTPRELQVFEILFDNCPNEEILMDILKCIHAQKKELNVFRKDLYEANILIALSELKKLNVSKSVYLSEISEKVSSYTGLRVSPRDVGFVLGANRLERERRNDGTVCVSSLEQIEQAISRLGISLAESPSLASLLHAEASDKLDQCNKSDEDEDDVAASKVTVVNPEKPSFRRPRRDGGGSQ